MQLKLVRAPHAGQTDMVVQTAKRTHLFEVGKPVDVSDAEAAEILGGQYGKCFEQGGGKPTPEGKAVVRQAQQTTAKASPEEDAAEEAAAEVATKVVSSKDYTKK